MLNVDRYLAAIVREYRENCECGEFANDYEAKRALWKAAVWVFERASDPQPYLDQLREASVGTVKPSRVEGTINSARKRVMKP